MAATAEETLAQERRSRMPAAVAAISAGVLSIVGSVLTAASNRDIPNVYLVHALRERADPPGAGEPGEKARQVLFVSDHALELVGVAIVLSLTAAALGVALAHLYRATAARRPEVNRFAIVTAIGGAVLVAVPGLVHAIVWAIDASSFADAADKSSQAARDALESPVAVAALFLGELGRLTLGLALVLVALNAMRVGLLTRFMGVLGIIVGVLYILPLGGQLPIVQAFWLIAVGLLFLGRWPGPRGLPPAWTTGTAQPWPTQQEIREQRLAAREERAGAGSESEPAARERRERAGQQERRPATPDGRGRRGPTAPEAPAPEAPARPPHPSSKKKKRKRR